MPLVPSVCSRNVAWWRRPHVQSFGSPYAARRSAPAASRAARDHVGRRLLPAGRRDVVPPVRSSGRRGAPIIACHDAPPPTYSRARSPSSSSNSAAQQRGTRTRSTPPRRRCRRRHGRPTPRSRARTLPGRPASPARSPSRCGRTRSARATRRVVLDRAPSRRWTARRSSAAVDQLDDPLCAVARVPLGRDEVRVARVDRGVVGRDDVARPRGPAARAAPRTGCSPPTRGRRRSPTRPRARDPRRPRGSGSSPGRT